MVSFLTFPGYSLSYFSLSFIPVVFIQFISEFPSNCFSLVWGPVLEENSWLVSCESSEVLILLEPVQTDLWLLCSPVIGLDIITPLVTCCSYISHCAFQQYPVTFWCLPVLRSFSGSFVSLFPPAQSMIPCRFFDCQWLLTLSFYFGVRDTLLPRVNLFMSFWFCYLVSCVFL